MKGDSATDETAHIRIDAQLDASGLMCPQPVIQARLALTSLEPGQTLELYVTDPHAELDLEVFCATAGHQLRSEQAGDLRWRMLITKG